MPTGTDYPIAIVIVNRHEPEGEAAGRLLELAGEKGYDARVVEAQRGESDVPLSFRVPADVAEAFNADRSERWPTDKIENDDEKAPDQGVGVNEDAYAAEHARAARQARAVNAEQSNTNEDTSVRKSRPGKASRE